MSRRGLGIAIGLALTASAACAAQTPQAGPGAPPVASDADSAAVAPDGDTPPDHPTLVVCATILGTMSNAILEGRATGDRAAIQAAYDAYRRKAAAVMGDDGSRQAIGSSYAFYDSLTPAQLTAASAMCIAAVDADFKEADWW